MNKLKYVDEPFRVPLQEWLSIQYVINDSNLSVSRYKNVVLQPDGNWTESHEGGGGKYIYIGDMMSIWGHCITDNLKKLWFLKTRDYIKLRENGYAICCTIKGGILPENFKKLLLLLDVNVADILIVNSKLTAEEFVVPEDSIVIRNGKRYYYPQYKTTIDTVCCKIPLNETLPNRIYLSRTKLKGDKKEYGEQQIEAVFKKLGFTIVYPEQLSFEEQMQLYRNCKVMASTEGSVAHNCLFAKDGLKQIVIRKSVLINSYQFMMMSLKNVDVTYIDAHLTVFKVFASWSGPFFMYLSDNLSKWANDNGIAIQSCFHKAEFLRYTMVCCWQFIRYRRKPRMIPEPFKSYYLNTLKRLILG